MQRDIINIIFLLKCSEEIYLKIKGPRKNVKRGGPVVASERCDRRLSLEVKRNARAGESEGGTCKKRGCVSGYNSS